MKRIFWDVEVYPRDRRVTVKFLISISWILCTLLNKITCSKGKITMSLLRPCPHMKSICERFLLHSKFNPFLTTIHTCSYLDPFVIFVDSLDPTVVSCLSYLFDLTHSSSLSFQVLLRTVSKTR